MCVITLMYVPRLHSWGGSLEEAFEQCAMATFGYIDTVEVESEGVMDLQMD